MKKFRSDLLTYSNTYKIYVLQLEQEKYYVGISKDVRKRYAEHCCGLAGRGAGFAQQYKPIEILEIIPTPFTDLMHAEELENKKTIELMKKYGIANVRGGVFTQCDTDRLIRTMPKEVLKDLT